MFIIFSLGKWQNHADVETVRWIQARNRAVDDSDTPTTYMSSSEDEEIDNDKQGSEEATGGVANDNFTELSSEEKDIPPVANKFALLSTE